MIAQLFFLWNVSLPISALKFLSQSFHPLRMLYSVSLVIVCPTILLPVILFLKSGKAVSLMKDIIDRISLLSMFYLFLDLIGLIMILIRNFT